MATGQEFTNLADLASARVGGRAIATNDDFFAPKSNLVKPGPAVFIPDKYTSKGKWMDGWESRRRRVPGHDWCIVALGMRGIVRGVDVDTSHFTGNFPSHCSIEAVDMPSAPKAALHAVEGPPWTTILEKTELRGNGHNFIAVSDQRPWTHLRLSIYPDGGVARLRVYGEVLVDWARVAPKGRAVDLASIKLGGLFLGASDMHYGTRGALLMPDRAKNMGDGWETKRSRDLSHSDWAIIRLGAPGNLSKSKSTPITTKGTIPTGPRSGARMHPAPRRSAQRLTWSRFCRRPNSRRTSAISSPARGSGGRPVLARQAADLSGRRREPLAHPWHARTNLTPHRRRRARLLTRACGASRWVDRMMARRPFGGDARMLRAARIEWFGLTEADWLEAFSHHPRIGDRAALEARFPTTHDLSAKEQSGLALPAPIC